MRQPIELSRNPDFSDIQAGVTQAHVPHALIVHPTWQFFEDRVGDGQYVMAYGFSGTDVPGTQITGHPGGTLLRMRCLALPNGTLVLTAREASKQEKVEYGIPQEDL